MQYYIRPDGALMVQVAPYQYVNAEHLNLSTEFITEKKASIRKGTRG